MKLNLAEILNIFQTLTVMQDKTPQSITTTFKIAKNELSLQPFVQSYLKTRDALIKKYTDSEGEMNLDAANEELTVCLQEEYEIELLPLKLSELDCLELTVGQIKDLFNILVQE
jgi:hypothetical protein